MANDAPNALRKLRLARGWTQNDLAERTGIPQPMLSRFETGQHKPKGLLSAIRLAAALGVHVEDLWPPVPKRRYKQNFKTSASAGPLSPSVGCAETR